MKPTPEISPDQRESRRDGGALRDQKGFPLTDYFFQPTVDAASGSSDVCPANKLRAFRNLSSDYFGTERRLQYAVELLFFGFIIAISAWPIVSAIVAAVRLVRNY
jgi:hypothetical protein